MREFKIVFKKELKSLFRGGISLLLSIVMPLLIMPFALTMIISSEQKIDKEINSPNIALYIVDNGIEHNIDQSTTTYLEQFNYIKNTVLKTLDAKYLIVEDITKAFVYEEVNVALYFDSDLIEKVNNGKLDVKLVFNETYSSGLKHAEHITKLISAYSINVNELRLQQIGSSLDEITGVTYSLETLQQAYPNRRIEGLNNMMLITIVPTIIIGFISFGSGSVSAELFSLEKERNTIESLLTTSAKRKNIVLSKLSVSILFSVIGSIFQFLSLVLAVLLNKSYFESTDIYFSSGSIISLVMAIFSLTLLAAVLNVLVFVFSKSNRSATAFSSLVMITPVLVSYVVMTLSPSAVSFGQMFIPFIGTVLAMKMAIVGAINYTYLYLSLSINIILSAAVIYLVVKRYCSEKILQKE
ncbi:MAG: ABC transporter permease [Acholeplasmataceae bacterium]|jgi:sodium transport system permease protein